ncbi:zinc ABC transporter substrate-binding protein [Magnetospirillum aberrantis]|uniref:High-affinity zinc uptake system protein ZnuA n=1 Tax=Magnetospirillum aberrantis SpK TaxID=908842 RepID=A0A7C9UUM0_9PROT|nr:zinc ABC transporter substrate-binding protein [Magnetospirillum aberrantis]NFV80386.1 zinc ABC transporter solute-binding protein [Magnetospirillum aberrantis SpK]
MGKPLAPLLSRTAFAVAALCATVSPAWAETPKVVASIQPLHSLVASVMKGVGEPGLIVSGPQSGHTYTLKPSDARALKAAQLVVLVDDNFETFLAKPLKSRKDSLDVIAMADLPGAVSLATRKGGAWEEDTDDDHGDDDHDHEHEHEHHGHSHGPIDGHVWLDPTNARLLVVAVADRLSEVDAAHADVYQGNAKATIARLDALDAEIKAKLAPVTHKPFVVFHDAYQYFEKRYGLSAAGSVTVDPDRPPSARRLAELRDRLRAAGAACVFREPQFPAPVVKTLADSAGARQGVLDPLGADIAAGPDQYFTLMGRMADNLVSCLGTPG